MSAPLALNVAGKAFSGWKSIRVTRTLEALCGSFSLTVADGPDWPISEDDACSVLVEGVPVITGYIDSLEPSYDSASHTVTVNGRDRAADVVDCSAQLGAWQFSSVDVLTLARKICAPYGVTVAMQPGLVSSAASLSKKYSIDPGDTAGAALENLCKVAGLLAISDGLGGVLLTRTGTERVGTVLVQGQNILRAGAKFDRTGRFRDYLVMGSHKGGDSLNGASASGVKGTATDMNARAGRTLVVRPDANMTPALAKSRAEWEASVRAARAESASVTVQGWIESDLFGAWPLNKLVAVRSPKLRVNGDMLIAGVTLSYDEGSGTLTQLDLRNPKAFTPDPTIAKAGGNNYWREIVGGV